MKPSKCMIFCRDARRSKALFETEAKASGFIKYNRYAIKRQTGIAPIRAYHCTSCDGWHVTSRKAVFDLPDKKNQAIVMARGSTPSRTRLYQMGIAEFWTEIQALLEVKAYYKENW